MACLSVEQLWTTSINTLDADDTTNPLLLLSASEDFLTPGRDLGGIPHLFALGFRFLDAGARIEAELDGQEVVALERVSELPLPEVRLRRFEGDHGPIEDEVATRVRLEDGVLMLARPGEDPLRLIPISPTRFVPDQALPFRIEFHLEDGRGVALTLVTPEGERTRLDLRV